MNLGTDPYQIQERYVGNNNQSPVAEGMDEFGKVGAEMSYIQSQMHSDYDSAESIADSDLEDGDLRKNAGFTTENAYMQGRGDCKSSRTPTASGKPDAMTQERGTSAKRTQADHSRRESLMSIKFVSRTKSIWETRCSAFIREQGTGKPIQEFYFFTR